MENRRLNRITWLFVIIMLLAVATMLAPTFQKTAHIQLPSAEETDREDDSQSGIGSGTLSVVQVRPDTVQAAIATMERTASYSRMVTVEQFWGDTSRSTEITVSAHEGWTRTDRVLWDQQVRHTITDGETTYIWYNDETVVAELPAGGITADDEQSIPTYEDILALPVAQIHSADDRMLSDLHCIYVETGEDEAGYVMRYWVSMDTGLLVAAEKLLEETTVYRMSALSLYQGVPAESEFTLPDGRMLLG